MFNILYFLQTERLISEKRDKEKVRGMTYLENSKACITCPSDYLLTNFLKMAILETFQFFYMWLRNFNRQKLMQFNFRGRFTFKHKGTKIRVFKVSSKNSGI